MMKLVVCVMLVVLAVASAQYLVSPYGAYGAYHHSPYSYTSAVEQQGTLQAHSPFAVSSSSRYQVHNSAPLLGLSPAYAFY